MPPTPSHIFQKGLARLKVIGFSSLYKITAQFFSILLSYIVIRLHSDELWGTYVQYLLVVQLASQILAWGSGDYVLREFSRSPNRLSEIWQTAFSSRSILILPVLIVISFSSFSLVGKALLALWVMMDFLCGLFGSVVIYLRKFKPATFIELSGHLLVIIGVCFIKPLDTSTFISLFVMAQAIKAIAFSWYFRKALFQHFHFHIDWKFLKHSFSFLMVGLIGLAQTKTDIYLVALLLEESDLGQYHIIMRWMSMGHLVLTFALTPYIQSFYRLGKNSIDKLIGRIFLIGIGVSVLHLVSLWFVFSYFYQFELSALFYGLIFLHLLPFYAYYLKIYELFKKDQQQLLIIFYSVFALLSAALSYVLIPKFGILGALITSTILQYGLLIVFFIIAPWYAKSTAR